MLGIKNVNRWRKSHCLAKALGPGYTAPSIDIFGLQHLVVEGLLNSGHKTPSSGRFYKLANPVDARVKKF